MKNRHTCQTSPSPIARSTRGTVVKMPTTHSAAVIATADQVTIGASGPGRNIRA